MEVASDTEPLSGLNDAYGGLYIGAGSDLNPVAFFSGLIDDLCIYDVALTTEEIRALAQ